MSYREAPEYSTRKCGKCGHLKPVRKHKKNCDECQGIAPAEPVEELPRESLIERSAALGYSLSLQDGDYLLEQSSEDGVAAIWLHPDEAYEIAKEIIARREQPQ